MLTQHENYHYKAREFVKVPVLRDTEPGLHTLFDARRVDLRDILL